MNHRATWRRVAAGLSSAVMVAVFLTGCSSADGEAADDTTSSSTSGASTDTMPPTDPAVDACALLDAAVLGQSVAFEPGPGKWTSAADPAPGTCEWTNDPKGSTLTISAHQGLGQTIAGLQSSDTVELKNIEVGGPAMTGMVDLATDRYQTIYVAAGTDSIIRVSQSPLDLDSTQMIAVATSAANGFNLLPPS
jgi:hypothetical protein